MSSLTLVYAADAICFFRILASITVVIIGRHPIAPYLFAAALISDLFDGWFSGVIQTGTPTGIHGTLYRSVLIR